MHMGSGGMGDMSMGSGMAMDPNDIDYDAFLAKTARSPIRRSSAPNRAAVTYYG